MLRNASRQSTHNSTKMAWWKLGDEHDGNRNVPAVLDSDKMAPVNRQLSPRSFQEPADHVIVDNFRFIDADRKWMQNQPRYVDEDIKRHVRSCRRVKSLDEDSDNANDEDAGSHNHHFESTFEHSQDATTTSDDVEQRKLSTSKRPRSRWTSGALLRGRSIEEQRVIDDLLSLDNDNDRSMDVDSDHETEQPVHHNCGNEFMEISNELQQMYLYHDETRTDSELTACSSSAEAINSPLPRSEVMFSTVEKETCDGNYSTGSSKVAVQLLMNKTRSGSAEHKCYATRTTSDSETVCNKPNVHYWNSVFISHAASISREDVDQHRSTLYEVNRSKSLLNSSVNSLSPLRPASNGLTSETSTSLCLLKSNFTSSAVSISYLYAFAGD